MVAIQFYDNASKSWRKRVWWLDAGGNLGFLTGGSPGFGPAVKEVVHSEGKEEQRVDSLSAE